MAREYHLGRFHRHKFHQERLHMLTGHSGLKGLVDIIDLALPMVRAPLDADPFACTRDGNLFGRRLILEEIGHPDEATRGIASGGSFVKAGLN